MQYRVAFPLEAEGHVVGAGDGDVPTEREVEHVVVLGARGGKQGGPLHHARTGGENGSTSSFSTSHLC